MSEGDGAIRDYSINPSKAHWRRTAWNFIRDHSDKNGVGLALLGRQAIDLDIAKRKGIDPARIVAVERNGAAVRELRRKGITTIHGDLLNVVRAWPLEANLNFVLADLCGPVTSSVWASLMYFLNCPFMAPGRIAFVLNALRGRESDGFGATLVGQHRGMALWNSQPDSAAESDRIRGVRRYFHSYRSGRLIYDSVMAAVDDRTFELLASGDLPGTYGEQYQALCARWVRLHWQMKSSVPMRTRRSVTAALAILTQRKVQWRASERNVA